MKEYRDPEKITDHLSDESRKTGQADALFLPECEEDVIRLLKENAGCSFTCQGARTGLTAGAVPFAGSARTSFCLPSGRRG